MKHAKESPIAAPITVQSLVQIEELTVEEFAGTKTLQDVTTLGLVHQGMLKPHAVQKPVVRIEGANQLHKIVMDQPKSVEQVQNRGMTMHAVWVSNVMAGNVLIKTRKRKLPKSRLAGGKEGDVTHRTGRNVVVESANVLKVHAGRIQTRMTKRMHVHTKGIVETQQNHFVKKGDALPKPIQKIAQILPAKT